MFLQAFLWNYCLNIIANINSITTLHITVDTALNITLNTLFLFVHTQSLNKEL